MFQKTLLSMSLVLALINLVQGGFMSKDFKLIERHLVENVDSEALKDKEEWAACEDKHLCGMSFGNSKQPPL